MACVKHFAMNSIENARFKADVHADKRTLFEVYLPHFKRCIEEGAASVMGAYNKVYGEQASESKYLLKDILRDKWGFEGFTLSDFLWAIKDGAKAVKAGMNVEMPCICHYAEDIPKALEEGRLQMGDIDESIGYILRTVLYYETRKDPQKYTKDVLACEKHIAIAKRAADESMVLLKNEGQTLPFNKETTKKIVVLGVLGDTENIGDHGSSRVHPYYTVTPLRGLMKKMPCAQVLYDDGRDLKKAKKLAEDADAVIIVAGYVHSDEGEFLADRSDIADMGGDRASMRLHKRDVKLIDAVGRVNPNTVVSIMGSSAILIDEWEAEIPAIIFSFYGGMEGGNALADILFGDICPSGKLPYTVALSEDSYPEFDPDCTYAEYEYYHGYCKMDKENIPVLYPFGYGLSYTSFDLGVPQIEVFNETAKVRINVKNTGVRKGAEVVQLYVGCEDSRVDRPAKILKDFQRVELEPGEEKEVVLKVAMEDMAYYCEEIDAFVKEDVTYIAYTGNSSSAGELQKTTFTFT
jgi:beta-glucosidase